MKVFATKNSRELGGEVAKKLNVVLSETEVTVFPDSEQRLRILDNVVDEKVIIVSSPSGEVDKNYFELFFLVDAVKRSGASKVILVIPYLPYERQDHVFRDGEAVSLEVIVKILDSFKVNKIIGFDFHTVKMEDIFITQIGHLSALPLFAEEIKKIADDQTFLVTPDMGGIRRIEIISEMLNNMPYAKITKNRNLNDGQIEDSQIEGTILKNAIIVDDMISTGKTLVKAVSLLREKGVEKIKVFATHGIFSDDAVNMLDNLDVEEVFVTNSVKLPNFRKLKVISIAGEIAKEI